MLDANTIHLVDHLWRGGAWGYTWVAESKQSQWVRVGTSVVIPSGKLNVYWGVHPIAREKDKNQRATNDDIAVINCLFADVDAKSYGNDKSRALAHIQRLPIAPSVIVDSGGGYHVYWLLDDPFLIANDADRKRAAKAEADWVHFVVGDPAAKDLARILRVPGTVNYKPDYAPNFPPVTICKAEFDRLYSLDELEAAARVIEKQAPRTTPPQPSTSGNGNSRYVAVAVRNELDKMAHTVEGSRNDQLFRSAAALGELVGAGVLDRTPVENGLMSTAKSTGLTEPEIKRTIRSGIEKGMREPRTIPQNGNGNHTAAGNRHHQETTNDGDDEDESSPTQSKAKEIKVSQATRLVRLAEGAEFSHTPDGEAFVSVSVNGHREHLPLRSGAFRKWLARRYYEQEHGVPSSQALQDAVGVLDGKAQFEGYEQRFPTRVGVRDGVLYFDLANTAWQAVAITPDGWEIKDNPPICFRRPRGMLPMPTPQRGGKIAKLREFVNIQDDNDWLVYQAWVIAAYRPDLPTPVLTLTGEGGAAKTTTGRVTRLLLDPNAAPMRSEPREVRDLMIAATNGWVVSFDNLSGLPLWLSDAICRLATGGGFSTRALFTDGEEIIFDALRPVILNGIDDLGERADLLDRMVTLNLKQIEESARKQERVFWCEFEKERPFIVGACLDAVAGAMRNLPATRLDKLPRMADFAEWASAAMPTLGSNQTTFIRAYMGNRSDSIRLPLESSPIYEPLAQVLKAGRFEGTATELLHKIEGVTTEDDRKRKQFPRSAVAVANQIRRIATSLRNDGIKVEFDREAHTRRRLITLEREGEMSSAASPSSAASKSSVKTTPDGDDSQGRGDDLKELGTTGTGEKTSKSSVGNDGDDLNASKPNQSNASREVLEV